MERVTAQRRAEQARMRDFLDGSGCLMEHLRRELDDPAAVPCGRCARCIGRPVLAVDIDPDQARAAVRFLRGHDVDFEARKRWPNGSNIAPELRTEAGKALCVYGDGGFGELVAQQTTAEHFSDELVESLARLVRAWRPQPKPTWITGVPSHRHSEAVESLVRRLAVHLGLEYRPVVRKVREIPPQADMENSAQQWANVREAFAIAGTVAGGPVLVVDDVIDSRWTMTVVGALLREAGAGAVFPVCLAQANGD